MRYSELAPYFLGASMMFALPHLSHAMELPDLQNQAHEGTASAVNIEPDFQADEIAKNMQHFEKKIKDRYFHETHFAHVIEELKDQNPAVLEIDDNKKIAKAKWGYVSGPDKNQRITLHRHGAPAFIEVNWHNQSYTEMWFEKGDFYRADNAPTYMKIDQNKIHKQWRIGSDMHNEKGPANIILRKGENVLELAWFKHNEAAFVQGSPSEVKIDLATNIPFEEIYARGNPLEGRRMHRDKDHLHRLSRDRQTGALEYQLFRFHTMDPHGDECTRELRYESGRVAHKKWQLNGMRVEDKSQCLTPLDLPGHEHP